jgi:hypothetical protein
MTRMPSEQLTKALGRAVTAVWGELPARVQHELFESAVRLTGSDSREQLAVFLHHRHPRTIDGERPARSVLEPDSLGG